MTNPLQHVKMHLVDSFDKSAEFMRWLSADANREILAFDVETSSFSPYLGERIRLAQFGDADQGWSIPFEGKYGSFSGLAQEAFTKYEGTMVGHNIGFDYSFVKQYMHPYNTRPHFDTMIPWHRTHDTMVQARTLNPSRRAGLKVVTAYELDSSAAAASQILDNYKKSQGLDWNTIPVDNPYYWGYGALDTIITAQLHAKLYPRIQSTGLLPAYDLEMAAYRVCKQMEAYGLRVDPDYCASTAQKLRDYIEQLRSWAHTHYGIENPNSNPQLIKFFQDNGFSQQVIKKDEKTGKEKNSVDKEILENIDHPLANAVILMRGAIQKCSNHLEKYPTLMTADHIIHPSIQSDEAKTTRMSIREPSFQNLNKRDTSVRNGVVPRVDHAFVSCDADQIEMRLLAHLSQDAGLKAAFESPEDFFCYLAAQIFDDPALLTPEGKEDPRRQLTKNRTYAKNYGAGDAKIAKTNRVPIENVQRINHMYDERFPSVQKFMSAVTQVVKSRARNEGQGYVTGYCGRQMLVERGFEYVGVNYVIQHWAAVVFKRCMVELFDAGYGQHLVLPVHDEIVLDLPIKDALEAKVEVARIMTATTKDEFFVPLTWDAKALITPDGRPTAWGGRELVAA